MAEDRGTSVARRLLGLASGSYLASCALGTAVATGRLRTGRARWVHHLLYVNTATLTGLALGASALARRRSGWWLLPAVVPLTVVPYAGSQAPRHILVAASAAPFYAAALVVERR